MLDRLYAAYTILDKIYNDQAYSSIKLSQYSDEENKKIVTRIVYGVLDSNIMLEYFISQLVARKPKNKIYLILKIGIYCLKYMNSMPDYAIIDNSVELVKKISRKELAGFVNAVLKKSIDYPFNYPEKKNEYLSVFYSKPLFLVDYYIDRYGIEKAEEIIAVKPFELEHIRYNSRKITADEFIRLLKEKDIEYTESEAGGFFVRNSEQIYEMFDQGLITFQSMTSMLAVMAMNISNRAKILDLCAAPGGKSVLMAERNSDSQVISCDIHPHRVDLIRKYMARMQVNNIVPMLLDATVYNPDFADKFDYVLCDVPCSGLGLINKKPDIMLKQIEKDIDNLSVIQYNILENASKYVRKGGVMVYSTCTTIYNENEGVIYKFLANKKNLRLDPITILGDNRALSIICRTIRAVMDTL